MKKIFSQYYKISIIGFLFYIIVSLLCFFYLPTIFNVSLVRPKQFLVISCIIIFLAFAFFMFAFIIFKNYESKIYTETNEAVKRYEALSSATNDAIWEYDMVRHTVTYNDRLKDIFKYSDADLKDNTSWWEGNIHASNKERVLSNVNEKLQSTAIAWEDEYEFKCGDGTYKKVYDRSFIVRDIEGKPIRLIGAMKDITHLRKLEKDFFDLQIKNKNQSGKSLIFAYENDKKKIKDELQEDVNQILASIKIYINKYKSENENITTSLSYLDEAIIKIRKISNTLFSSTFEMFGLKEGVIELCNKQNETNDVHINLNIDSFDESRLSKEMSIYIYRVVEDRMNKILDFIHPNYLDIFLQNTTDKIMLTMSFETTKPNIISHLGDFSDSTFKDKLDMFESDMKVNTTSNNNYEIVITI